jgi:hypothetical protein
MEELTIKRTSDKTEWAELQWLPNKGYRSVLKALDARAALEPT